MEYSESESVPARTLPSRLRLIRPIRDTNGRSHFGEEVYVLSEIHNLDRRMFLVRPADGTTTFVFPGEVGIAATEE
jgi:hypothetical protein